ncbi:DegT/DnrJ/EryC1/StrS aminotransferase family protein [Flavobacterium sp. UMI-01]|uniref:DegT/DnrJ/EryC1/StrS family aminotransferase n=1 Tax=Flavobacterium sp. UMI-01 TaxID=1441053 RepID=UPI001C7E19F4|nr:DegT/DnrJ/EryC1/StrS family aminotransferase [Flavobacterium sp. UMI-01]GIZ07439.1 pyridoxal phosphate-dependent aminotransferase [Flavobacterium sp. UMI-01]
MSKTPILLSSAHQCGLELGAIQEAFAKNAITSGGMQVTAFEEDIERYLGEDCHVAGLNSGTAAIHLGLKLLGVQAGDEVLCQSMTFSASANPILYLGALPVFIDSEEKTWNLCPIALEQAIVDRLAKGKKPKAIIAVHLYGIPYQVEAIHSLAQKYQIPVLEDAAEALGSTYKGQKCGAFGDIGIFSFNGNKIITTSGGGALITKDENTKNKAIFYATQSKENAPHYQHSELGYNYRMSSVSAAIGRAQIQVLDSYVHLRRAVHAFYVSLFSTIPEVTVFSIQDSAYFANYWLTAILVTPNAKKSISQEQLRLAFEQDHIEARPLWKPMHVQPVFENCPYYGNNVAQGLFEKGLCLPSGSNLTDEEKDRITTVVQRFFN